MTSVAPTRHAQQARVRDLLADRGFDPDTPLAEAEGAPTLADLADEFRRISVLETAPVPGIEWLKRTSQKLGVDRKVQDDLWRAYDRQIRDEWDHGAYWGEMWFMLTGQDVTPMPWDADGVGGSNVEIEVPPDGDDESENRTLLFLGAAYSLGLESGFAEVVFPELMTMMKGSSLPITQSFVPLLRQVGRDEARHLNIHRYVVHALAPTQGEGATELFIKVTNRARRAFRVPEITSPSIQRYVGRAAPPTTTQVLGEDHLRLSPED